MSSPHCIRAVFTALTPVEGILSAEVTLGAVEVEHDGRFVARVDLAWPEAKLAVEYDGAHHFEDGQIARDDARIARLRDAGWHVIRLSAPDLHALDAVVARVKAALASRSTTP